MQVLFQNVLNICADVKNQFCDYLNGLLLYDGKKNCSSMARNLGIPSKRIYKLFDNAEVKVASIRSQLQSIAKETRSVNEMRVFAIDGTNIVKAFAEKIQNLALDYDGVLRRPAKGLSVMVASLLMGGNVIPLDFSFWKNSKKKKKSRNKKSKGKKIKDPNYKTKIELAIELIIAWKELILFDYIAMDGAFSSEAMISFLDRENLKYSMRIARSRKVIINGVELKLNEQPPLKLVRNERQKSAKGLYKGHACTFTVQKRKKRKGGWETIYVISNMELSAKDHIAAYNRRWPIDKSFRSMKQYLGFKDCQMCDGLKQTLHIFSVFLAYALATLEKIANGKKSVEEILKVWRNSKNFQKSSESHDSIEPLNV
jgi:hypothetical protein